jgi:protein gp37
MGDKTGIEWTDATWTPIRARERVGGLLGWHCEHRSEACRNCYAEAINLRLGTKLPFKPGHLIDGNIELFLDERLLTQPLRWARRRDIFVCSMTDLFGRFVRRAMIVKVFAIMALAEHHRFQVLTKRPQRAAQLLNDPRFVAEVEKAMKELLPAKWRQFTLSDIGGWPLRNVMLGTSAGGQRELQENLPSLLNAPAAERFLSYEPALGPIDPTDIAYEGSFNGGNRFDALRGSYWWTHNGRRIYTGGFTRPLKLDQVIAGGESGRKARPPHPDWFRAVREQCRAAGVPFFFKQWGEWAPHPGGGGGRQSILEGGVTMQRVGKKKAGALLDGRTHREMPK